MADAGTFHAALVGSGEHQKVPGDGGAAPTNRSDSQKHLAASLVYQVRLGTFLKTGFLLSHLLKTAVEPTSEGFDITNFDLRKNNVCFQNFK